MRFWSLGMVVIASALVAACTYDDGPDPTKHFLKLEMDAPQGNEVVVCHAYGCKIKTPYRFTSANIAEIKRTMRSVGATTHRRGAPRDCLRHRTDGAPGWRGYRHSR